MGRRLRHALCFASVGLQASLDQTAGWHLQARGLCAGSSSAPAGADTCLHASYYLPLLCLLASRATHLLPCPLSSHPPPTQPHAAKSQAPCILLLDELDALAPSRAASTSEHERQATARLLAAMDELRASRARVALVGATNRREAVDAALRRAGRLDCEVRWMAVLGVLGSVGALDLRWLVHKVGLLQVLAV